LRSLNSIRAETVRSFLQVFLLMRLLSDFVRQHKVAKWCTAYFVGLSTMDFFIF
jgi:hypothetical protein